MDDWTRKMMMRDKRLTGSEDKQRVREMCLSQVWCNIFLFAGIITALAASVGTNQLFSVMSSHSVIVRTLLWQLQR